MSTSLIGHRRFSTDLCPTVSTSIDPDVTYQTGPFQGTVFTYSVLPLIRPTNGPQNESVVNDDLSLGMTS